MIVQTNFREVISEMLSTYKTLGCKMFYKNLGDVSNENNERFHRDKSVIENHYKGKRSVSKVADYYWPIKQDDWEAQHKQRR